LLLTEPESACHHAFGILYPAAEVSPYSLDFEFDRTVWVFVMLRPANLEREEVRLLFLCMDPSRRADPAVRIRLELFRDGREICSNQREGEADQESNIENLDLTRRLERCSTPSRTQQAVGTSLDSLSLLF
jgi:hypothetical protein